MSYSLEIQKLLLNSGNYFGEDRINILKQAIKLADANHDIEWGYDLRIEVMNTCMGSIKSTEALPAFVWIIDVCDNNPGMFDPIELLWKYRWMIDSSARSWQISLETLYAMLDDFKKRLIAEGISLRSYYGALINIGFITENVSIVKENMELKNKIQRDSVLDNFGNDLYDNILYKIMIKDTEGALALTHETKSIQHLDTSFSINCSFSEYLTRIGMLDEAQPFIERAEQAFSQLEKLNYLSVCLSQLIFALTITDVYKAWDYVILYINWIFECEDYDKLIYGLNLLPLMKKSRGQRTVIMSPKFELFRNENCYNLEQVFDFMVTKLSDLAIKFDSRNGNSTFINLVKEYTN